MATPDHSHSPSPAPAPRVSRTPLLTATIDGAKSVARVEVKRIDMGPGQPSGLHLHPCPVVGVIIRGSIVFQLGPDEHELITMLT